MIRTLMVAAALGAWHMETERDPLGQAVYVASVAPDAARPHVALRFLCGGVTGVVLQFNLGDTAYARAQFLPVEPAWEDVEFEFPLPASKYHTTAKRAPITDGLSTYEIKGADAAYIVHLLKNPHNRPHGDFGMSVRPDDRVSITRGSATYTFPLSGASSAIGEVLSACPFKYQEVAPPSF